MRTKLCIPENLKPILLASPATDAAGRTSRYISLKNAVRAWLKVTYTQGHATPPSLSPVQATAVAGTGSKVLANALRIWSNLDCAASDVFVRRTDAVNYTPDAALKEKIVIFEIDKGRLDIEGGFDAIGLTTGASNIANITCVEALVEPMHGGDTTSTFTND